MNVLLHTCCGPCASACVARLKDEGHNVALYFSNSNIATKEEFDKRLASAKILASVEGIELFVDEYNHEEWIKDAATGYEAEPEKGLRCTRCFRHNLLRTAHFVKKHNFDAFTTSLTVSPHKVSAVIFEEGRKIEKATDAKFLEIDFKKKNGFLLSLKRTKELGLYRQSNCGCEFSCSSHSQKLV